MRLKRNMVTPRRRKSDTGCTVSLNSSEHFFRNPDTKGADTNFGGINRQAVTGGTDQLLEVQDDSVILLLGYM